MVQLEEEFIIRKNFYQFLGNYFYQPPGTTELKKMIEDNPFEKFKNTILNDNFKKGVELLAQFCLENFHQEPEIISKRLEKEFYRLFIGPDRLKAPPYESVYLGKEKIIFDIQTLQVRDCYRTWGMEAEKKYKEPDDHIGLEIKFLSLLIDRAIVFLKDENEEIYENLLDQQLFLSQHVLAFGPEFLDLVIKNTEEIFYKGLALLASGFLEEDLDYLQELKKEWEPYLKMAEVV